VTDAHLTITIKDNGRGFDLAQTKLGNGLANMRRRIEDLGGHFEINSKPGHGSTVQLTLQMNQRSNRTGGKAT
jgi:signal transduction histidine kinase